MAEDDTAMTPEEAAAAIAGVRDYRQGLTARTAGILWMLWGLAFAAIALLEMSVAPGLRDAVNTPGTGVSRNALWFLVAGLAVLASAVVASNAVWRSHAIARDEQHNPWIAWGVTAAIVVGFNILGLIILQTVVWVSDGHGADINYIFAMPVFSASGALALGILLRRRVNPWPAVLVAALLILLIPVVGFTTTGALEDKVVQAAAMHSVVVLAGFIGVGSMHFRRG